MIRRSAIQGRKLSPLGYKILIEVLGRSNVGWISEVPYTFRERAEGSSKLTNQIYLQYFQHLLRLRFFLLHESKFVRFCVVGCSGVVIDMTLLFLFSDPKMLGWGLTRSKLLAARSSCGSNCPLSLVKLPPCVSQVALASGAHEMQATRDPASISRRASSTLCP